MELRYRREAAVGAMLVLAGVLFVLMLMWLRGQSFRRGEAVRAVFADVAGLKVGDPVRTSGVGVGQVKQIVLEEPGRVVVTFELYRAPSPRQDARAVLRSQDFFGARYIEYSPGRSAQPLDGAQPIRGASEHDISGLASSLVDPGREVLANAADFLAPSTAAELRGVLVDLRRLLGTLRTSAEAPSREATAALAELTRVFQRLDLLLGNAANARTLANVQETTGNLARITATLEHTSVTLDSLMAKLNDGRGLAGRLVNDSALVNDLRRTNSALADLLIDIRANPGRYIRLRL